ncbi:MAG: hypothetical protein ACE5IQ_07765 [Candidatus Methylomirabilales bacterium]
MRGERVKTYLALGFVAASVLPWFVSSNVLRLIARQKHVLLGRYSLEWFSILFFLTPILWMAAYAAWSLRTHTPKEVIFRLIALGGAVILGGMVVDVVGRIPRKPRYIEQRVGNRTSWPHAWAYDIVRHRPPDQVYRIRYTDAPPAVRSYPSPPSGYPTVDVTLTTDHRGYRNLTRLTRYDIVTVGDSFTEGSRVSDDESWPVLLGQQLNRTVYNLGISGGNPGYYVSVFRAFGLPLKPKIAIFMIYEGNDFRSVGPRRASAEPFGRKIRNAVKYSPIVLSFKRAFIEYLGPINADARVPGADILSWMPAAVPPGPDAKYYAFKPKRLVWLYWTASAFRQSYGWRSTAEVFRQIKAACAREGVRMIFTYAPSKPHVVMPLVKGRVTPEQLRAFAAFKRRRLPSPEEFTRQLFDRLDTVETVLREFLRDEGIEFVSPTEALRKAAAEGRQVYYTYDQHWTSLGHEVVAGELARYLTEHRTPPLP